VTAVVGRGIEQGQQQRDRQHLLDQQFGQRDHVVLHNVPEQQVGIEKAVDLEDQIEGDVKDQKSAQTISQRHEQLAQ
jgi:hypothetical protein